MSDRLINPRIMIDMSATLIHHGHIRLINKAAKMGQVIIGLTSDYEIEKKKGYKPELNYKERKEILESIENVSSVVQTPWAISNAILNEYKIDFLFHGDDNANDIDPEKLIMSPRTKGISSSEMRQRVLEATAQKLNSEKVMYTPGPASVLPEWYTGLIPLFGRGDNEYQERKISVYDWLRDMTGHSQVVSLIGSSTLGIEIACHNFLHGKILVLNPDDYYAGRIQQLIPKYLHKNITTMTYDEYLALPEKKCKFDWITMAHVETSKGYLYNLEEVKNKNRKTQILVDATASIGLETGLEFADVACFSSCKGLYGPTGGAFITSKFKPEPWEKDSSGKEEEHHPGFYLNYWTHYEAKVTGCYHQISILYDVKKRHKDIVYNVEQNKLAFCWDNESILAYSNPDVQPNICTLTKTPIEYKDENYVEYQSRIPNTHIQCHLNQE